MRGSITCLLRTNLLSSQKFPWSLIHQFVCLLNIPDFQFSIMEPGQHRSELTVPMTREFNLQNKMNRGISGCKSVRLDPSDRTSSSLENLIREQMFLSTVVLETMVMKVIITMEKKNHQVQVNHKE